MLVLNNVPFLFKKVPDFFGYEKGLLLPLSTTKNRTKEISGQGKEVNIKLQSS